MANYVNLLTTTFAFDKIQIKAYIVFNVGNNKQKKGKEMKRIIELKKQAKINKGITLIALVTTIVVLLILAGITVTTITGDKGLIKEARTSAEKAEKDSLEEQIEMIIIKAEQKYRNPKMDDIIEELKNGKIISEEKQVNIETGRIESDLGYIIDGKLDDYISKEAIPGKIVTGEENKEYNKNGKAIIPVGFMIVPGCDDVSKGLVISDEAGDTEVDSNSIVANGNQFVWIPVTNMDDFKLIEGYAYRKRQNYVPDCSEPFASGYSTEEEEYKNMRQSVEKNQGFYIGRYEAGIGDGKNAIVKKNSSVYKHIKWGNSMTDPTGGAVELSKNFIKGKSYEGKMTSTLVYGVQWDATIQFLDNSYITENHEPDSFIIDSTNVGSYDVATYIATGSNENYKIKNIYDMAGNVREWTMEAKDTNSRVQRGGNRGIFGYQFPISVRVIGNPVDENDLFGFRIALQL